jgi:hypothetical protein
MGASTTRVEEKHTFPLLDSGSMSMTIYDSDKAGCSRIQVEEIGVMQHINQNLSDLDHLCSWKTMGPATVHVPPYRMYRGYGEQCLEHLILANVTSMNYQIHTCESFSHLRW